MMQTNSRVILVATIGVIFIGGCSHQSRAGYDAAGVKVVEAAKSTGNAMSEDATEAGHKIADSVDHQSDISDQISSKVKDAIMGSSDVQTTDLSVVTVGQKVVLRGTVLTEVQNQRVEHLARGAAGPNFEVDDQLKVSAEGQNE